MFLDPAPAQLGFGVLELSQSQDVEEHTVTYEVDKEPVLPVTTNSSYTGLSDVDANIGMKHVFWHLELFISIFVLS